MNTKKRIFPIVLTVIMTLFLIAPVARASSKAPEFTVVIDAGHGGHDHGAIDNGAREKDINLGVANKLAALIKKKMKNVKVVMTRDDDTFISLQERANIANRNKGDLFISIHTNSVDKSNPNRTKIAGASVYALGSQKSADNLKVARRENSVIELERDYHQKYSGFDPSKDESYIIFEMAQKKTIGQSLRFAEKAQKELVKAGRNDRGVRQAGFWVLWATSMPAVLVELDFICNPQAADYLTSSKGQEELAEALFNAFELYVANNKKTASNMSAPSHEGSNGVTPRIQKNDFAASSASDQEETVAIASTDKEVVPTVPKASAEKKARTHNNATPTAKKQTYGPRKRRSQASREASAKRNVETDEILVKSETDYLVKIEEPVEQKVVEQPQTDDTKGKKKKKKKEKKPKAPKKPKENKNSSKGKKNSNTKTFVISNGSVSNTGSVTPKTEGTQTKGTKDSGSSKAKKTVGNNLKSQNNASVGGTNTGNSTAVQPKKVYKILLLSSPTELEYTDAQFHGLRPTGMFVENNQYKYTIGASESRKEIETKLNEIKSILPGASIVVRME